MSDSDSDIELNLGEGDPSGLVFINGKARKLPASARKFWRDLLTKERLEEIDGLPSFLKVESSLVDGGATTLIYRDCYEHLISRIIHCWNHESRQCVLTGTPGIGKTIFGYFLIRHLIRKKLAKSVAYVAGESLYLITLDPMIKKELGIETDVVVFQDIKDVHNNALLRDKRIVVIHDPEWKATDPAHSRYTEAPCRLFILSYGHDYIRFFKSKDIGPALRYWFFAPLWDHHEGKRWEKILREANPSLDVEQALEIFGGSVRKWMQAESNEEFEALRADLKKKVLTIVKTHQRNTDVQMLSHESGWRGTIIQISVPFDKNSPLWECKELKTALESSGVSVEFHDEAVGKDQNFEEESEVPVSEENAPNSFGEKSFIVGSPYILEQLAGASSTVGAEHHFTFMAAMRSEAGYEDMYGRIFEPHCHALITKGCKLRIRRLTLSSSSSSSSSNGSASSGENEESSITLPKPTTNLRFDGHDPEALKKLPTGWCSDGSYLQPHSNSFPSCDSIYVVKECVLRPNGSDSLIALNFQMTVSGVNRLPPRPKHALRRYIRSGINAACRSVQTSFKESVTVFAVPDVCFDHFPFQREYVKDAKVHCKSQPKEQFVVAVPETAFALSSEFSQDPKQKRTLENWGL